MKLSPGGADKYTECRMVGFEMEKSILVVMIVIAILISKSTLLI